MIAILVFLAAVPCAGALLLDGVLKISEPPKILSRPRQALLRGPLRLGDGAFVVEFADEYARSDTKGRKAFLKQKASEYKARSDQGFPVYAFTVNKSLWSVAVGARPQLIRIILESEKLEMMGAAAGYSEAFSSEEMLFLARGAGKGDVPESRAGSVKLLGEVLQKHYWEAKTLPEPLKDRLWDFVLSGLAAASRKKIPTP